MSDVDPDTTERLARNEAFFREVNERIEAAAGELGREQDTYECLCECADPACAERITISFAEYEEIRSSPIRFVIAPGHDVRQIEQVVEETGSTSWSRRRAARRAGHGARPARRDTALPRVDGERTGE